jgi:DNA-binding transcriptional MerR regulator
MKRKRMSTTEVAELIGVTPSTVRSYTTRGQMPSPSPCTCCGSVTYDRVEIQLWNQRRLRGPHVPKRDIRESQ